MILWLIEFLPYLWVVTVPVYGSFCGIDLILRISILLFIYVIAGEMVPKSLHSVVPYLSFGLWVLIVYYVPINLIPWPVIWLYDKLLWITGPVLMITEIVLALNFQMRCSQRVCVRIQEDDSSLFKLIIILFSAGCYALMASFLYEIYSTGSTTHYLLMFLVLIMCVAVHNMMWMSQDGILCDAAFTCMCTVCILYAMKEETTLINSPLKTPSTWFQYDPKQSMFHLGLFIFNSTVDSAGLAIGFLMKFLRPFFLLTLGVRLYSILYIIESMNRIDELQREYSWDTYEYLDEEITPWKSPLTMKLAVVFMFTQMTSNLFYESQGVTILNTFPFNLVRNFYPKDIIFGRVVQMIAANCFYIWRLSNERAEWSN
ncbi:uncharacterized protein LOC133175399 [Saccostrea echinata]|nr:uncharacterized protein LOC133175399 [Saccostrea echinata]